MPGACALTVDVDDREGPEGEASPAAQPPSHQLDDLCNLVVALPQEVLAGTQEGAQDGQLVRLGSALATPQSVASLHRG